MMLHAAIFDLDGLLVDSEPLWTRAEQEIFATVGIDLDEAACAETVGMGLEQVVDYRYRQQPWDGPGRAEIARAIHGRVVELVRGEGRPLPGALPAIGLVKRLGWRVGLATASDHQLIDAALGRLGTRHLFDHLQSAQEVARGKPHPDVYLACAAALGVEPAACVGFEDSLPGLQAIRAAGMKAVAVPERRLRGAAAFQAADLLLDSLEQLNEELLLGLFARVAPDQGG